MSRPVDNPAPPDAAEARVAHELSNLLDGALRHVNLALARLEHGDADRPRENLRAAGSAMAQMTALLQRWRQAQRTPGVLYRDPATLIDAVDRTVRLLRPEAEQRGIRLNADVAPAAAHLPAGPLPPAIANALRNSLEAINGHPARDDAEPHHVDLAVRLEDDQLHVTVTDTGAGVDPALLDEHGRFRFGQSTKSAGGGLGMLEAREVADSLGGVVELTNRSPRGARFVLRCPARSLVVMPSR